MKMFENFFNNKFINNKNKISSPQEQLDVLKQKFGTNLNYVDVTIPMTYSEVEEYFGPQCKEYEPLCACCYAWIQWNKTNMVTVTVSREDILKAL